MSEIGLSKLGWMTKANSTCVLRIAGSKRVTSLPASTALVRVVNTAKDISAWPEQL